MVSNRSLPSSHHQQLKRPYSSLILPPAFITLFRNKISKFKSMNITECNYEPFTLIIIMRPAAS
jgi:hypothetical protein